MARKKQIHSFDSSSDMSTSSSCNNSVATQTSHSSSQGNSDEGIPIAKKKKSGQCSCETKVDPQDDVSILSNRQTLLACIMFFVVGVYSGVAYVGWVQLSYGFGVDPELEERYLPYGPSTVRARDDAVAAPLITSPTATATTKKRIQLNRDNRKLQKPMVSTLFGIEYGNVVGSTAADSTAAVDDDDAGDETKTSSFQISSDWYRLASTSAVSLTPKQVSMIQDITAKSHATMPNLVQRAKQVSWGGPQSSKAFAPETNWWQAGHLLHSYLRIMKWQDKPKFPFRLCGDGGCPPERAIAHTLEFRENYKPWLAPPTLLEENVKGYSYHRGFSPAAQAEKHAIVWLRLGHYVKNDLTFFRGIIHAADRATGESLVETGGSTGKFNAIIDCGGFSLAGAPTIASLKQFVTMLQDHYPNRLGMIYLVNLSRPGQIMLSIILRIITKEVRDKIKVLPNHNPAKSLAILKTAIEERYIPDWLGGTDTFQFNVEEYYPPHLRCTEDEAREFLTTMPYHAK